jgi:hypothetical protein
MTTEEAINGLKHTADDHPCCRVFLDAVIERLTELDGELRNIADAKPGEWGSEKGMFRSWAQNRARFTLRGK